MKYITYLVLIFLIFSQIIASNNYMKRQNDGIERKEKGQCKNCQDSSESRLNLDISELFYEHSLIDSFKAPTPVQNETASNKFYQLSMGIIFGMAGEAQNITEINHCLPDEWNVVDTTPPIGDDAPNDKPSKFIKLIKAIGKVVGFVCKFKKIIIDQFTAKMRKTKYQIKMGTSIVERNNIIDDLLDYFIKKILNRIEKIINWENELWENFKDISGGIIKMVDFFVVHTFIKVKAFFTKETFLSLMKFIICAKESLFKLTGGLASVVLGIIKKSLLIASIAGNNYPAIVKLVVDLICNFPLFQEAFYYLMLAIKEDKVLNKYALVGKFLGTGFRALVI